MSVSLNIRVGDEPQAVETGTKAWQLFAETPDVIAARVNGELKDLSYDLVDGDVVEPVDIASPDGLDILRHSTAHVMAQAVQELFPQAKLGIGPPVVDGFYYDFDVEEPFVPEDLEKIESRMRKIIKEGQKFSRRDIDDDDARVELADEPYKLELIGLKSKATGELNEAAEGASVEVGSGGLTMYDNLKRDGSIAWTDLCRGPHLPTTKRIPAFKLMRSAAAYWRGNEKNKQLQRIYGTAWPTKEALADHLHRLEEAQRRDHRRLGTELDLFSFPDEIGSGLPVFHPKGGVIKRVMEDYVRQRHIDEGFEYVGTPHIAKEELYYTSGHLPYYGEGMFPPLSIDEGGAYRLKAMNCPMHNLIFRSRQRSYRELPLRLFEFGHVYRNEKSGVIHGLTRVRGFAQDDSHSYVTPEQAPAEVKHLLEFMLSLLRDFGMDEYYLELSTRDDSKDKFIGSDEDWAKATAVLEEVALSTGVELVPDPGGAAYYGPKISVQARDAIGRTWQMGTVQYDFNQPSPERFALEYIAPDGSRQQPVMIHSAKFGSIERFMGVLVEHYAGAFPPWLAPVQAIGIPVAERHADHLAAFGTQLRAAGIRFELDASDERMQKKIRNAQTQKIPFMLLAGDADVEAGAVSFRFRNGEQINGVPLDDALARITDAVRTRVQV